MLTLPVLPVLQMYVQESPPWMKGLKLPAYTSLLAFFVAMILFYTAFFGHSWYVTPRECVEPLTTLQQRQGKTCDINFGLFWLCHRGHCIYNMRVDYMVVGQLSYKGKHYITAYIYATCAWTTWWWASYPTKVNTISLHIQHVRGLHGGGPAILQR